MSAERGMWRRKKKKRRTILGVKTTPARKGTDASHKRWAELMGTGRDGGGGRER